jgi:DNA-binding response OmpR family regulator
LPITDPAPLAPPEPAPEFAQTLQAGSLEDRIVLLVENDAELRRALVLLLEKWGAAVIEAATGEEALLLIDDLGILPDALIVDQQLGGGLTGLQTIAALRARGDAMPARLISADRSESLRDLARQANVVLLIKPVQTAALRLFLTQRDTTKEA